MNVERTNVALVGCKSVLVAALCLAALNLTGAGAKKKVPHLNALARFGSTLRGTEFSHLTYYKKNLKGRLVSHKALVKVPKQAKLYLDKLIRLEDLKKDEDVFILGRAIERDVPSRRRGGLGGGGRGRGKDYQIQAARVILCGESIEVNTRYKDPRSPGVTWRKATVLKSSAGLWVTYDGNEYRVSLEPRAPVLRRVKCEKKLLKSGRHVLVTANKMDLPAEAAKKSPSAKEAFLAKRIVVLDPRYLRTAYTAILP